MTIYEMRSDRIEPLNSTSFEAHRIRERSDLQRLLRDRIEVAAPGTMVIAEEFGDWEDSKRRIDLLAIDKAANLVVIELKRSEDRGPTELQAIRYAAMISTMTFGQVVEAYRDYLLKREFPQDAEETILDFLEWNSRDELAFGQAVRIVLVAESFSKELTTAVMWLNQRDLDIRCVRMRPYELDGRVLIDVQQTIPLPEAAEYQVQIRKKALQQQAATTDERDYTKYDVTVGGATLTGLPKRRAIHVIVKYLCDTGTSPEAISTVLPDSDRRWRLVDGEVDRSTFEEHMNADALAGGRAFSARRWFLDDDELIRFGGRTYAFSNQWGGGKSGFSALLTELINRFGQSRVSFLEHA